MKLNHILYKGLISSMIISLCTLSGCSNKKQNAPEENEQPTAEQANVDDKAAEQANAEQTDIVEITSKHAHDIEALRLLDQRLFPQKPKATPSFSERKANYKTYYTSLQTILQNVGFSQDAKSLTENLECHTLAEGPEERLDKAQLLKLKDSLKEKIDFNATNERGNTILHELVMCAASEGSDLEPTQDLSLVEDLLTMGADIKQKDAHGQTILMKTRFLPTANQYIAAKGDVNAADDNGTTALHAQIRYAETMSCKKFFYEEDSMGCINEDDPKGKCETHADLRRKQMHNLIKKIMSAGADINAKDKEGISPVMMSERVAKEPNANINDTDALGRSVFMHYVAQSVLIPGVCKRTSLESIEKLGADINYINPQNGMNALAYTVELRRDIFEYKKDPQSCLAGPDCIFVKDDSQELILLNPIVAGKYLSVTDIHQINELIAYNDLANEGHYVDEIYNLSLYIAKKLIKMGVNANIQSKSGKNVVLGRAAQDDKDVIKLLNTQDLSE